MIAWRIPTLVVYCSYRISISPMTPLFRSWQRRTNAVVPPPFLVSSRFLRRPLPLLLFLPQLDGSPLRTRANSRPPPSSLLPFPLFFPPPPTARHTLASSQRGLASYPKRKKNVHTRPPFSQIQYSAVFSFFSFGKMG